MPAPPYFCGTEMPSRPRAAMPPRTRSRSNRCCRSASRMCGAISRAPHSRTDCSSRRCSSVRSKLIINGACYHARRVTCTGAPRPCPVASAALAPAGGDLEMIGAAEERAELAGAGLGVRRTPASRSRGPPATGTPSARRADELLERPPIDVGDEVAEAVHAHDLAARSDRRPPPAAAAPTRTIDPAGRPSVVSATPFASQAAAGAKRSRPSKVRLTVGRA